MADPRVSDAPESIGTWVLSTATLIANMSNISWSTSATRFGTKQRRRLLEQRSRNDSDFVISSDSIVYEVASSLCLRYVGILSPCDSRNGIEPVIGP